MSLWRVAAGVALAVVLSGVAGWIAFDRWRNAPLAIGAEAVRIEIPKGQALAVTARKLAEQGVLEHPRWLILYARATGADARVRAGEYELTPGATPITLLELLQSGRVVQHAVTFVEGATFRDLRRILAGNEALHHVLADQDDATVMRSLGEAGQAPEGLFFPDTYLFGKGTSDLDVLRQARARMRDELEQAWSARAEDLPYAMPYEALVLASIVEKETALGSERARIAGVFTERLRRGMRLQTDPTVIYGLGAAFDGNLRRSDLERDGPYNTYTRTGLPPTPIAMPGRDALQAAVRPDERGDLYFVATGLPDGSHAFSRTHAEHQAAVRDYLVRYRQRKSER